MANSGPSAAQSESSTLARRPGGGAKAYVSSLPLTVAIFVEKLRHLLFLNRAFEPARARVYNLRGCSEFSLFTLKSRLANLGEVNSSLVTRGAAAAAAATAATATAAAARALFQTTKATNTATHCDGCLVV